MVSPGGVGFDISCGVRLLASVLTAADVAPKLPQLMDLLDARTPRGTGRGGLWHLTRTDLHGVLTRGSRYAVEHGHGVERDLARCEDRGAVADARADQVSDRAVARGRGQVGSLGSAPPLSGCPALVWTSSTTSRTTSPSWRRTPSTASLACCVHRKGASRAWPPGHPELPADLAPFGQPVLVPGSMGTASYVLAGVTGSDAFHSACHGAGRVMSRHAPIRKIRGQQLREQLETARIVVRGSTMRGLAEDAPFAYKDIDEVVQTCRHASLARRVARLRPSGVVKG